MCVWTLLWPLFLCCCNEKQGDFEDMGISEALQSDLLVPSINAAFEAADILAEKALASMDVDDLEATLGELSGEVSELRCCT